ncbi:MAG: type II secretion system F family protein [Blastocatellia bacterium]
MDLSSLFFYGSVAGAIGSVFLAFYWLWVRPGNPVVERLREINPRLAEETAQAPVSSVIVERVAKRMDKFGPAPSPRNVRRLRRRLMMAGFYDENASTVFRVVRLGCVVAFPLLTFFVLTVFFRRSLDFTTIGATLLAVLYGLFIPSFTLSRLVTNRKDRITRALPDALDLMVVCVEAGLGLNAALQRVGREMELVEKDLSTELAITNREIRAGKPRDEALRNLGDRTGVDDVKSLVAMLVQTDRFGTSIAESLRVFADSMRTKRRQRAEEQVAKAAIKLIFPLLLFIFPALLIVLMGPALIKLTELFGLVNQ